MSSTTRSLLWWVLTVAVILAGLVIGIGAAHGFWQWLEELCR